MMTKDEIKEVRVERISHLAERTIAILGIGMVVLAVALFFAAWILQPGDPYSPLGPYPDQQVTAQFEVDGYPAFAEGDAIPVSGEKCTEEPVEVIGDVQWQSFEPPGTFISIGTGRRVYGGGCESLHFVNEMPQEVIDANRNIRSEGFDAPVWVITGIETPIDLDTGESGEPLTWTTEPFVIVDERP